MGEGRVRDVRVPGHPRAGRHPYVFEHILVAEDLLGRYLVKGETVHHRNCVRDDNRPENLELWVRPQPSGIRANDAIAWAHEIIERYEGDDAPPTALTLPPENSWRWRGSNGVTLVRRLPDQHHICDSICGDRGTQRHSLAPVGTRLGTSRSRALRVRSVSDAQPPCRLGVPYSGAQLVTPNWRTLRLQVASILLEERRADRHEIRTSQVSDWSPR